MKHKFTVVIDDNRIALQELLAAASAFLGGAPYEYREVISIETDHDRLASLIGAIIAQQADLTANANLRGQEYISQELPGPYQAAQVVTTDAINTCKYCGAMISRRAQICGSPECKKMRAKEYERAHRRNHSKEPTAEELAAMQQESDAPASDPFPDGTEWMIDAGDSEHLAKAFLSTMDLNDLLENYQLPVGTILTSWNGKRWKVHEYQDGLEVVPVDGTAHTMQTSAELAPTATQSFQSPGADA